MGRCETLFILGTHILDRMQIVFAGTCILVRTLSLLGTGINSR
jgi:hypothetical protein